MKNGIVYLIIVVLVIIGVVIIWNNNNEGLYFPKLAPNQVYQGNYTNPMTTPNPREWSCPPGTDSPYCCQKGKAGELCRMTKGRHGELPLGYDPTSEGYRYSGMEPASDREPINIIAPPFTEEVFNLGFGMGEGIFMSGRQTSEMFG
jgi:hypothetical protein